MSKPTPTDQFLKALDNHIGARLTEALLPHQRMPARGRSEAEAIAAENCATSFGELKDAITSLLKDSRRPGI